MANNLNIGDRFSVWNDTMASPERRTFLRSQYENEGRLSQGHRDLINTQDSNTVQTNPVHQRDRESFRDRARFQSPPRSTFQPTGYQVNQGGYNRTPSNYSAPYDGSQVHPQNRGYNSQLRNGVYDSQLRNGGYDSQLRNRGYDSQLRNRGYDSQLRNSGYHSRQFPACSGNNALSGRLASWQSNQPGNYHRRHRQDNDGGSRSSSWRDRSRDRRDRSRDRRDRSRDRRDRSRNRRDMPRDSNADKEVNHSSRDNERGSCSSSRHNRPSTNTGHTCSSSPRNPRDDPISSDSNNESSQSSIPDNTVQTERPDMSQSLPTDERVSAEQPEPSSSDSDNEMSQSSIPDDTVQTERPDMSQSLPTDERVSAEQPEMSKSPPKTTPASEHALPNEQPRGSPSNNTVETTSVSKEMADVACETEVVPIAENRIIAYGQTDVEVANSLQDEERHALFTTTDFESVSPYNDNTPNLYTSTAPGFQYTTNATAPSAEGALLQMLHISAESACWQQRDPIQEPVIHQQETFTFDYMDFIKNVGGQQRAQLQEPLVHQLQQQESFTVDYMDFTNNVGGQQRAQFQEPLVHQLQQEEPFTVDYMDFLNVVGGQQRVQFQEPLVHQLQQEEPFTVDYMDFLNVVGGQQRAQMQEPVVQQQHPVHSPGQQDPHQQEAQTSLVQPNVDMNFIHDVGGQQTSQDHDVVLYQQQQQHPVHSLGQQDPHQQGAQTSLVQPHISAHRNVNTYIPQAVMHDSFIVPIPPQCEPASTYQRPTPNPSQEHADRGTMTSDTLLNDVTQLVLCSTCKTMFNRAVICDSYQIEHNRAIQCECHCVTCTLCYRSGQPCRLCKLKPKNGIVSTTTNSLTSCPDLDNVGDWDLERNSNDLFKTKEAINRHVQHILTQDQPPSEKDLDHAFEALVRDEKESMSFKYWPNKYMPVDMANRYVCISHVPGFWDRVIVATHTPLTMEDMIGHDDHLPKLFGVTLGFYRFHWCCFVLMKQIILAMWCTDVSGKGQPRVVPLVDTELSSYTDTPEFKHMAYYLSQWFTAQYTSQARELKVVLDCKPSQGSTFVHFIAFLASKIGISSVTPNVSQVKTKHDMNYHLNIKVADEIFTDPSVPEGGSVNVVEEFAHRHKGKAKDISVRCVYTNTERYML